MILGLYRNKYEPTNKPLSPGSCAPLLWEGETQPETVEHIPLIPDDGSIPPVNPPYLLIFDKGTANKLKYKDLRKAMNSSATASSPGPHYNISFPTLFQYGSKAIMDIIGIFQKG